MLISTPKDSLCYYYPLNSHTPLSVTGRSNVTMEKVTDTLARLLKPLKRHIFLNSEHIDKNVNIVLFLDSSSFQ